MELKIEDIPIKIDITNGSDGNEINEIVFALNFTAEHLKASNALRSDFMKCISKKIEKAGENRINILATHMESLHLNNLKIKMTRGNGSSMFNNP